MNENMIRGFLILPIACIGVFVNWTVVLVTRRITFFKNSFGYLSANQALGDAIHSTTSLFYMFPMLIFDSNLMKKFSKHCAALLLFSYELSVQIHFLIAINRFFAAFTPMCYNTIFSEKTTRYFIVFVWLITVTTTIVCYEILCSVTFSDATGFFEFTDSSVCAAISWYNDFCKYVVLVIIIVILDISTVVRVRYCNTKVRNSLSLTSMNRKSRREMNFLKQTVFQGAVFVLELISFFILPRYLNNHWEIFFSTSFAWIAVHAIDGVVTLICNPEYHRYVFTSWNGGSTTQASD